MTPELKRVIGFILYYQGKIVTRACNFCVRIDELETSKICEYCKSMIEHPNYQEEKKYFLEDWHNRKDGQHDKDWPWEQTLPDGALGLLDKAEGKVFTPDEVVELVSTIFIRKARVEAIGVINEILRDKYGIKHKCLDDRYEVVEVK